MNFENINNKDISYYVSSVLHDLGMRHGFCDASIDFSSKARASSAARFCSAFQIETLSLLTQQHTDRFVLVENEMETDYSELEADAFILSDIRLFSHRAFGVISADCIPMILVLGNTAAVVHSGWRGLANGIITNVIRKMEELSSNKILHVVIGPCAGKNSYEVGEEVINAIGKNAVYRNLENGKYLLSLVDSASNIIKNTYASQAEISSSDICVISNEKFFSYRREGSKAGRNLSFVMF